MILNNFDSLMSQFDDYKDFVFFVTYVVDSQPDTHEVDRSEIRTQILLATASSSLRGRQSFTHMLSEVRLCRYKVKSIKLISGSEVGQFLTVWL